MTSAKHNASNKSAPRTIAAAQKELREWGDFWRHCYEGGNVSIMHVFRQRKLSETKKHRRKPKNTSGGEDRGHKLQGVDIPTDALASEKRQATTTDREIFVPPHLRELDEFIATLPPECIAAIKTFYERKEAHPGYWLNEAERRVMLR
ncbi:hypothetical protein LJ739_06820 [Aestuariibacter halophilus]|uniref:Uncharacterized protein n=1 Tax=Fluctibacter halophilus TaxID=226011 RepID=A0ABS8G631_9ALTE|nr:hypothetical protein [Aestuariibacter halophilus]MCC2615949.1 hypothetical protein [Aestuariibacter halophilus]